jgi:Zn-dependent M28 family amino/carboxypeptidase
VRRRSLLALAAVATASSLIVSQLATAAPTYPTKTFRDAVTVEGAWEHLEAFQAIADANDDTRASGTAGYDASVAYVVERLKAAGYDPVIQTFEFPFFSEDAPPILDPISPDLPPYESPTEVVTMQYSGSGPLTAQVVPTNDVIIPPTAEPSSTSGCELSDYPAEVEGNIALIQRGTCTFEEKVAAAQEAGAIGVIIFNEGQEGRTDAFAGTLSRPFDIPVVFADFATGQELYNLSQQEGGVTVRLVTETTSEIRDTYNVLADTSGNPRRTVVVGAHLDSVLEGPGINDNGTGSAALLEIAEELAEEGIDPRNRIRFAWWGGEESGLLGSEYYVSQLSKKQIARHFLNLNFDMIGSTNYVRFVYDGNGSDTGIKGPSGSGQIESVFVNYFDRQGLPTEPTEFSGRSDYGPFIAVGIPAGGLFTGAEGLKTEEQEDVYGGEAGIAYDPCYHQACDTIENVDVTVFDQMLDAVAHATLVFGMTKASPNGTGKASPKAVKDEAYFTGKRR